MACETIVVQPVRSQPDTDCPVAQPVFSALFLLQATIAAVEAWERGYTGIYRAAARGVA